MQIYKITRFPTDVWTVARDKSTKDLGIAKERAGYNKCTWTRVPAKDPLDAMTQAYQILQPS